jgi:hypothetical protein
LTIVTLSKDNRDNEMHSKVCLATVVEARNSFVSLFFVSIIILIVQMWVDHASADRGRREEARDTPTRTSSEAPECEIEQPKAQRPTPAIHLE